MGSVGGRNQTTNDAGESRVRSFEQTAREISSINERRDPFSAERFSARPSEGAPQFNGSNRTNNTEDLVARKILPPYEVVQSRELDSRGRAQDDARPQFFVAQNGDDRNPGTAELPWQTIQKGARSATPGSVVNVMPGEYHGQVNVTVSGNERDGFISFRSAIPGKAVLDLKDQRGSDGDPAGFKIDNKQFIEVSGFEIRNLQARSADSTPNGVLITGGSSHIRLNGLDIHHIENDISKNSNAHGISVYGNGNSADSAIQDIVINNNKLHDLKLGASEALVINGNVANFTIANNNLYRLNNIGIDIVGFEGTSRGSLDQPRLGTIQGNYVSDVDSRGNPAYGRDRSAGGIYVDGGTTITISGNKVERANIGIELASEHAGRTTSNVVVAGNLLINNTMAGIVLGGSGRSNGGSTANSIENNRLVNNDTDGTGSGEIAFQNNVSNTTIRRNTLVSANGTFFSGSQAGNTVTNNDLRREAPPGLRGPQLQPDDRRSQLQPDNRGLQSGGSNRDNQVCRDNRDISENGASRDNRDPDVRANSQVETGRTRSSDQSRDQAAVLFDRNASAEEKLASVKRLYDSGLRDIVSTDQDGNEHKFRLETVPVGSNGREMVHLFAIDQSGREHVAIRGIADATGNFERERNPRGRFVDYYGNAKAQLDLSSSGVDPNYGRGDRPDLRSDRRGGNSDRQNRVPDGQDQTPDRRPRNNSSHQPMEPVTDPAILKDVGRRPDGRPVEPTYIGVDNSASYLGSDGQKHIKAGVAAWLDKPAAQAYILMNEKLARVGKHIQIASEGSDGAINSAGRTHTQQRIATGIHAAPGNSVHEQGRGMDVRNFEDPDVRAALREFGFVQGNLSRPNVPIRGDAWHFSFNPKAESSVAQRFAQLNREQSPFADRQPRLADQQQEQPRLNSTDTRYSGNQSVVPTGPRHYQLKDAALNAASRMGTVGRCAAGVQVALSSCGLPEFMGSGNAWPMGQVLDQSGKFQRIPMSQAAEGDIIVRSWNQRVIAQNGGKNFGDIVIVTGRKGGQLMGANDHHGSIPPDGGRYENSFALRLIG